MLHRREECPRCEVPSCLAIYFQIVHYEEDSIVGELELNSSLVAWVELMIGSRGL